MKTAIDIHPRTTREIERIKHHAQLASKAINWLVVEGFTPLEIVVQCERRAPVVRIALSTRCGWLKREYMAYKHEITATHVTWRANVMGVRVQWIERGN
jgi:hypothetical protein